MNNSTLLGDESQTTASKGATAMATPLSPLIGWCSAFGVIALAVITGNSLNIAVLTRRKMIRKRTSFFLISLAAADLMVGTFSVPSFIYQLVCMWQYGVVNQTPVLKVVKALDVFSGLASTFTLTIIALERVYAICFPLRHRISTRCLYHALVWTVWILAGLLSSLYFFYEYRLIKHKVFFLFLICTFFFSMFIMFAAYTAIWLRVRSSGKRERTVTRISLESSDGSSVPRLHAVSGGLSASTRTRKSVENEKRLAGTVCIVTTVFVLTWLPFHIINLIIFVECQVFPCSAQPSIDVIYFCKLLHYTNSFLNPVIYSLRLQDFRLTLTKLLLRKPSLQRDV